MYGYSTSAVFAYRFALLHPEIVEAVFAGGVGGAIPIPLSEYKGENLIYPVGTSDLENIIDSKFNEEAYRKVKQFYFMGSEEKKVMNNGIEHYNIPKFTSLYDEDVGSLTCRVLGEDMYDRMNKLNEIYIENGYDNITLKIYEGFGHVQEPSFSDMYKFYSEYLEKSNLSS
ncbi:MAG TPA: hypothetical protein DEP72_07940 [Clostridiales bacterium]|nr:MAG: hypothetical protein A2Y18_06615 [Clostridiales bacterium GWD2_32_19]HCC08067.1 hypothetical protein [Clostridiales bacterium]